jgi:hypothetical protein
MGFIVVPRIEMMLSRGTIAAPWLGHIDASSDIGTPLAELCAFLLPAMRR